jgi:cell division protein FtsB
MSDDVQYWFIVSRDRADIFQEAAQRFRDNPRIEVVSDRRHDERRRSAEPAASDRRRTDRRRPATLAENLGVYPALVVRKHIDSPAELRGNVEVLAHEAAELRAENERLRNEIAGLKHHVENLARAGAVAKSEIEDALAEAARSLRVLNQGPASLRLPD